MKFSIGDNIILKRTGEEGVVTAYVNQQMVEVEVQGTLFPVYIEDIDHPYLKWFTEKNAKKKKQSLPEQLPVERIAERQQRLARGVYLSFMPVFKIDTFDEVVDQLKVYILNELPQPIKFSYDVRFLHRSEFSHEGTLHGFGNVYLHSISYADMNDQPRFHWQLTDTTNAVMDRAEGVLRIRPAKLFEHVAKLLEHSEPTFSYTLIEDFSAKKDDPADWVMPEYKPKPPAQLITVKTIEAPKYEVDLHVENLLDDKKGLSNADIIKFQLDTFQRYLQLAIVHRQERMVVIHGLGKGKLREEVHAILKHTPAVARFKNEWSGRYGFGATDIYFRY
ncbi:MAG: Smr/MutS family protein [Bacteroidota bacterium]